MCSLETRAELRSPGRRLRNGVREHVYPAISRDVDACQILWVCKHWHGTFVRFFDSGLSNRQWQIGYFLPALIRTGEQLDAIRTFLEVVGNQRNGFIRLFDIRHPDMVLEQKG